MIIILDEREVKEIFIGFNDKYWNFRITVILVIFLKSLVKVIYLFIY